MYLVRHQQHQPTPPNLAIDKINLIQQNTDHYFSERSLIFHKFLQNNKTVNLSIFTTDYIPCNGHGLDSEWTLDRGDVGHAQQMVSS